MPYNPDYPSLEGKKLLKFGVVTMNTGAGPSEIIADRSGATAADWTAYQTFYDAQGKLLGSVLDPHVQYYFAGDGHNHWHVRDFDDYSLLSADGTVVARAEKHGYCMQDNNGPTRTGPGVPTAARVHRCHVVWRRATERTHHRARSQPGLGGRLLHVPAGPGIDISGLPNGRYTVQVHADAAGAVTESNDNNNTARVKVDIAGDTVTVVPGSSSGA